MTFGHPRMEVRQPHPPTLPTRAHTRRLRRVGACTARAGHNARVNPPARDIGYLLCVVAVAVYAAPCSHVDGAADAGVEQARHVRPHRSRLVHVVVRRRHAGYQRRVAVHRRRCV